jgi:hypothetical protein
MKTGKPKKRVEYLEEKKIKRRKAMRKWKAFMFFLVSVFFFISCSKRFLNLSKPTKGTYVDREYFDGIRTIDPNDTITIEKYSKIGRFEIIDIEERKTHYNVFVRSDSVITFFDSDSNIVYSRHIECQVVSLKSKKIKRYEKIKKGEKYDLTLIPNIVFSDYNILPSHRGVYVYTKERYLLVVMSTLEIYTTYNLDGLYYVPCN